MSARTTVRLNPAMARFVSSKVRAGEFASPEDAVNGLLAHLKRQEELTPQDIAELRAMLDPAIAEADRGEFVDVNIENIIAERRAAMRARRKKGA